MLTALPRLRDRLYADFLMRSRLDEYERLLECAIEARYRISSVGSFWRQAEGEGLDAAERYLVLRHDIDTDPRTAATMWAIDRRLGVESSYFFRLSTMAPQLLAEIAAAGSEASYHYEELSTVAKRLGLRSRAEALAHLAEARELFAENLRQLRATTGLPMRVVASHGDFANRRLGVANWVLLADPALRREVDVELETYDEAFLGRLPRRYTDAPHPRHWAPADPAAAILAGEPVISILVHPRHWRADRGANARDAIQRIAEGIRFELPVLTWRRR